MAARVCHYLSRQVRGVIPCLETASIKLLRRGVRCDVVPVNQWRCQYLCPIRTQEKSL